MALTTEVTRFAWSSGWHGLVWSTAVPSSILAVSRPAIAIATIF